MSTGPPILFGGEGVLEAGTYVIRLSPHGFPNVLITVPDGWSTDTNWYVGTPGYISGVLFWNVVDVYAHPCRWKGPLVHPGPTVDDLVAALVGAVGVGGGTVPEHPPATITATSSAVSSAAGWPDTRSAILVPDMDRILHLDLVGQSSEPPTGSPSPPARAQ